MATTSTATTAAPTTIPTMTAVLFLSSSSGGSAIPVDECSDQDDNTDVVNEGLTIRMRNNAQVKRSAN